MNRSYLRVCKELIRTDLHIFKTEFWNKCIDLTIWVVLNIGVTAYLLPQFGLSTSFGLFQFGGILSAAALFEMYGNVASLVSDLQHNRIIDYNLTLPIPSWMAIISKACYYFLIYIFVAMCMIPVGKLCLWEQFDLTKVSYIKLALALIFQAFFYASFILLPVSIISSSSQMRTVWARFIFPLWITGGFQFSWFALHAVLPHASYLVLLNPLIYITESIRIALMGQEGFMNYWLCLAAITGYALFFLIIALNKLKKKLDYV